MLREVDIFDKGKLALDQLFTDQLHIEDVFYDKQRVNYFDGELHVNGESFLFEVISRPSISKLNKIVSSGLLAKRDAILVFDFVSDELAEYCKSNKINYLDSAGNAYINSKKLIVFIEGRQANKHKVKAKRIFQKTGLKLLFEFFRKPSLMNKPYRFISEYVEISTASVGNLIEELQDENYLMEIGGEKKFNHIERLVLKWVFSYTELLKPKLHRGYFKLLDPGKIEKIIQNSPNKGLYFSGEYAASFSSLRDYVKPSNLILYTDLRISELARDYGIVPVSKSTNAQLELLEPFWNKSFEDKTGKELKAQPLLVHDLIIYADLLDTKNPRSVEIAEQMFKYEIRDRLLKNFL